MGHSFTKDNNWNCDFFRKYAFQMKNIKHAHTHYIYIYIYINLLYSLRVIIICMHIHLYTYIYIYIYSSYAYICVLVCLNCRKLLKHSKLIFTAIKLNQPAQVIKNFSIRITATLSEDF